MSFINRIFGRKQEPVGLVSSEFVEEPDNTPPPQSEGRDTFFDEMKRGEEERQANMIHGVESESEQWALNAVKTIIPRTLSDMKVVQRGDDEVEMTATGETVAMDSADGSGQLAAMKNFDIYQFYAKINPRILRHYVSRAFIGYPACTILGQDPVISLCCSMPAEDAIAPGFDFSCVSEKHQPGDEHLESETAWLDALELEFEQHEVVETCIKYGMYKRLYGIGIALPICELKDGHTFEEPYDPKFIKPGSFRGFNILDPQRAIFDLEEDSLYNPMSEWYMKPKFLRIVNGTDTRIHRSWIITSNYRDVGDDLKATYMWGGVPLPQIIYERLFCAEKLANEVVALAMSKRTVVMDGNKSEMIMNPNSVSRWLSRFNQFRNNDSVMVKEAGTQIQQLDTSLSDLQPLGAQQFQWVASWSGIPMTRLCKNVPSGLQATGQYEQEDYEQTCNPIRKDYKRLMNRWLEMYVASVYPDRDDLKLQVTFRPFITPKATEVQQIDSQRSSMVCQLVQTGIIDISEARGILLKGGSANLSCIATKTPELLKKIEAMKDPEKQQEMQMRQQQMMMGGMGGQPGMPGAPGSPSDGQAPENPKLAEGKQIFGDALKQVLGEVEGNVDGGKAPDGAAPQDGSQGSSDEPQPVLSPAGTDVPQPSAPGDGDANPFSEALKQIG